MEPMETTANTNSSSKLILSIIAILVVVGIGYAVFRDDGMTDDTATTTPVVTDGTANEGGFSGNLFELAARGGSWKCTWESDADGLAMTGTVFVDRGKFKSDAEVQSGGMTIIAHTIGDGEFVYSWTNLMTTGFKFRVTEGPNAVPPQGTTAQAQQFASMYNYDCDPWTADSGTFALPTGVTFTETTMAQ